MPPPSEERRDQRPRASRTRARKWLRWLLIILAATALAVLVYLALQHIGLRRTADALASVTLGWLVVAFGLMALSLVLRAQAWHVVLRAAVGDVPVRRRDTTRATMIGVMMSSTLPGRLGEPSRAIVMARHLGGTRRFLPVVAGSILAQTLLNVAALIPLAVIVFATVSLFQGQEGVLAAVVVVPLAIVALVAGAPRLITRGCRSRVRPVRNAAKRLDTQLRQIRHGLVVFRRLGPGVEATLAQFGAWALQLFACYAVIKALGLHFHAELAAAAGVLLATNVAAIIPVTPANVGVFQAACLAVLAAYHVGAGDGLAYGIVLQAVEVATALLLGVPALIREGLALRDLRAGAEEMVPDLP
jgi:phosphatidylinositol alpha-mannosyltransferase